MCMPLSNDHSFNKAPARQSKTSPYLNIVNWLYKRCAPSNISTWSVSRSTPSNILTFAPERPSPVQCSTQPHPEQKRWCTFILLRNPAGSAPSGLVLRSEVGGPYLLRFGTILIILSKFFFDGERGGTDMYRPPVREHQLQLHDATIDPSSAGWSYSKVIFPQ